MKIHNHGILPRRSGSKTRICGAGLLLFLLASGIANAGGSSPDLRGLDRIPMVVAPAPVIEKALLGGQTRKDRPLKFAVTVPMSLTTVNGVWDDSGPAEARWRMRVFSSGAKTLHFHFANVNLPSGASLWVYDPAAETVQGPYTAADLSRGEFWSAVVRGETAIIEARLPSSQRAAFQFTIADVQYGFLDWSKAGSFGTAGSCEIDVACSQGNAWTAESRSVGLIQLPVASGSVLCSGTLVNDVPQDDIPYFVTASHCEITSSNASNVVVYWLDQASSCGAGNDNISHNQTGATHKLTNVNADLTLLQLNSVPSAAFNVYYAGWDVRGIAATSGVGIHHPRGDAKKISVYNTTLTQSDVNPPDPPFNGATVKTWKVFWQQGVTEQGSSGSGLWSQGHLMVGVLHGGRSQCTVDNSDPSQPLGPTQPDFYGRLDVAWSNGLRCFLDPLNSSANAICGRNAGAAACAVNTGATGSGIGSCSGSTTGSTTGGGGLGGGGGALSPGLLLGLLLLRRRSRR